jgi:hypothetical protein
MLEITPGAADPTNSIYNSTMYAMALLLVIALVANLLIKPVHEKHYLK